MKIVLLSDTLIGSAEGCGATIDKDSVFDEVGLPIIPGKRIRGLLKEQGKLLHNNGYLKNSIIDLFGEEGNTDKKQDYLSVSNFTVLEYKENKASLYSKIKEKKITRSEVIKCFTTLRTMTRIDEDGIAEDSSLRTFRLLKKGAEFIGELSFKKSQKEDFDNMIMLLRRVGTMRNRGLGHIKCSISEKNIPVSEVSDNLVSGQKLVYKITTLEPLIITQHSDDPNMYETLQYIRGTVIQGVFAQNYLKSNKADSVFTRLIVKGDTVFSNAYPFYENNSFFPAPLSIVREKYAQKKAHNLLLKSIEEQTSGISSLVNIKETKIQALTIPQEIRLHNKINNQTRVSDDGKLFNYQSLPAGMVFKGHIFVNNQADIKIINSLIKSGSELRIGRSALSEYGKVLFEWITEDESCIKDNSKPVIMRLLSDTIIYNKFGFSSLNYQDINNYLKGEVKIHHEREVNVDKKNKLTIPNIVSKKSRIEGFLNVWKLRKPSENVFASGSCFWLDKLPDNAEDLENKGLGERTVEGYGEVLFSTVEKSGGEMEYLDSLLFIERMDTPDIIPLIASDVIESISYNQVKSIIEGKALSDADKTLKIPNNHLLGKLRGMAANPEAFIRNLDDLKEPARKQLRNSHLEGGDSLYEHIKENNNYVNEIISKIPVDRDYLKSKISLLQQAYLEQYFIQLRRKNNRKK